MRFIGDIPIARLPIEYLSRQGHDAISVRDRLPPSARDPEIVRVAAAEKRVILCFDLDLAGLVALPGESLPSVITFRTTKRRAEYVNERLDAVLPEIAEDLSRGALATVEDRRVRVRPLPVASKGSRRS
jgi:predicted nuclease of predicted toxin-antitoxin system